MITGRNMIIFSFISAVVDFVSKDFVQILLEVFPTLKSAARYRKVSFSREPFRIP